MQNRSYDLQYSEQLDWMCVCVFMKEPHLVANRGITHGKYYFSGHKMTLIFHILNNFLNFSLKYYTAFNINNNNKY